jgi:hypothetical protein
LWHDVDVILAVHVHAHLVVVDVDSLLDVVLGLIDLLVLSENGETVGKAINRLLHAQKLLIVVKTLIVVR